MDKTERLGPGMIVIFEVLIPDNRAASSLRPKASM